MKVEDEQKGTNAGMLLEVHCMLRLVVREKQGTLD
jgi:hypothetical protein